MQNPAKWMNVLFISIMINCHGSIIIGIYPVQRSIIIFPDSQRPHFRVCNLSQVCSKSKSVFLKSELLELGLALQFSISARVLRSIIQYQNKLYFIFLPYSVSDQAEILHWIAQADTQYWSDAYHCCTGVVLMYALHQTWRGEHFGISKAHAWADLAWCEF